MQAGRIDAASQLSQLAVMAVESVMLEDASSSTAIIAVEAEHFRRFARRNDKIRVKQAERRGGLQPSNFEDDEPFFSSDDNLP